MLSEESGWPLRKNWTSLMKPVGEVAVAVMVCGTLTPRVTPLAGPSMATLGAVPPVTVTVTAVLVVILPPLSVARTERT